MRLKPGVVVYGLQWFPFRQVGLMFWCDTISATSEVGLYNVLNYGGAALNEGTPLCCIISDWYLRCRPLTSMPALCSLRK